MVKKRNATGRAAAPLPPDRGSDTDDDVQLCGGRGGAIPADAEVGFAKLQGEDFEYYMQTYSIVLGRNSKNSEVDVDLASLGGGMNISRRHGRIFYDFTRRRFALEVLGKNGCFVEGVLHVPGTAPVKLDSQDLLQMGDKQFYFLLPRRSIFGGAIPRQPARIGGALMARGPRSRNSGHSRVMEINDGDENDVEEIEREEEEDEDEEDDDNDDDDARLAEGIAASSAAGKRIRREPLEVLSKPGKAGSLRHQGKKSEGRTKADREADNLRLLQLEEEDVISSVASLLSDLCPPGEWMPVPKLHEELLLQFGSIWHHSRIRKYLTSEDWPKSETKGKAWYGLSMLLRKYPEHFTVTLKSKGRTKMEFVSLAE